MKKWINLIKAVPALVEAFMALWRLFHKEEKPEKGVKPAGAPVVPPNTDPAPAPAPFVPPPPDPRLQKIIEENTPPVVLGHKHEQEPGPGVQKHVSLIDGTVTYERESP